MVVLRARRQLQSNQLTVQLGEGEYLVNVRHLCVLGGDLELKLGLIWPRSNQIRPRSNWA